MTKRSKQEIIAQILEVCLERSSKTRIVYQVNLNFRTINPYLQLLLKNELLDMVIEEQKLYKTTAKGEILLESIKKINESISYE
ncbi:MAG TPA: winged helix-turn-helix domain-containing protein [Methanothrix sp.]|nr:winged helix-turn-helix domain-containing protein [Methanothrix sp.]